MSKQFPAPLLYGFLAAALLLSIMLSISLGAVSMSFRELLQTFQPLVTGESLSSRQLQLQTIILRIRLPRTVLAALVGASLAVSGVVYQGVFRNPLADPYILGVSSGAAFGVSLGALLGVTFSFWGISGLSFFAFAGGISTSLLVMALAGKHKSRVIHLLLAGISISFLMSALIYLIMYLNRNLVDRIVFWTMGSFSTASWSRVRFVMPVLVLTLALIWFKRRDLNVMLLGDESAQSLGINVQKTRLFLLVISASLTSAVVSVSGIIGFVGLITPHAVRLIIGSNHKQLIPASFLAGAAFMVFSDTLARMLFIPAELPVGIITGLVGAPYFLFLLTKDKRGVW